jgi:hypothetical protein
LGIGNDSIIPFDHEVTRSSLEQRRARKAVHIQLCFGRHIETLPGRLPADLLQMGKALRVMLALETVPSRLTPRQDAQKAGVIEHRKMIPKLAVLHFDSGSSDKCQYSEL